MSSSSNSGEFALQLGPFSAMPFEQHLLNPGADALRKESRALLPEARRLLLRAAAASFDFGPLKGVVTRALDFLDSERSDDLPDAQLADRLEAIRQTLDEIRLSLETLETEKFHRVTGQSGPGSRANQQMGPSTSPTAAVQVASRKEDLAAQRRRKRFKGEDEWAVPVVAYRRHFAHYALINMVYRDPVKEKRAAYECSTGYWKQHDFFVPYRAAHPDAPNPDALFNGKLPGGLQVFWGKAKGIRQQKRTMEAENLNEADVDEWVEQQVLSFSGMTAEDRETWGQPATNAVTVSSTALALSALCPRFARPPFPAGPFPECPRKRRAPAEEPPRLLLWVASRVYSQDHQSIDSKLHMAY
jgi:hypothetical protein